MNELQNIQNILTSLCSVSGISGYEKPIRDVITDLWKPWVTDVRVSPAGNLYACKKADIPSETPARKVLFAVHMDGIGMIVSEIIGEFIRFAPVGGFDPRVLPGQFVDIHAASGDIRGLIVMPGANLTREAYGSNPIPLEELFIDTGLSEESLKKTVRPGDTISFANLPVSMLDDTFSAHTLDNRASVAALTCCLQDLAQLRHRWDVYAVATVQEEESFLGGMTAPFDIQPDIAIAIDVTFAKGPGADGWRTCELGSGANLGIGMNIHPALYSYFKDLCEAEHIPYTTGVTPGMSGTDADPMQTALMGFPAMVVSIPLRYMHTANEIISLRDVRDVGKLLTAFVKSLDETTMDRIQWEDDND